MCLEKAIINEIIGISKKYDNINKVVLFGSRARNTNALKSDIDLAIYGTGELADFIFDINEKTSTLLEFDITIVDDGLDELLIQMIEKEGICIYEKH